VCDERFIDVRSRDGHLWLHSDGWLVGKHLVPLADGTFTAPVVKIVVTEEPCMRFHEAFAPIRPGITKPNDDAGYDGVGGTQAKVPECFPS